jgi:hypothetical protein
MTQAALALDGGHCSGPLFAPRVYLPSPKSTRLPGMRRRWRERHQTPSWAEAAPIRALFANAERITRETGVVHSVEHMVPLAGGTVCGLHWHGNMEVRPLRDNLVKGTRWWPDMWETQQELFE